MTGCHARGNPSHKCSGYLSWVTILYDAQGGYARGQEDAVAGDEYVYCRRAQQEVALELGVMLRGRRGFQREVPK